MSGWVIITLLYDLVLIGVPPLQMFLHVACSSSQVFATIKANSYLGATDTLCTGGARGGHVSPVLNLDLADHDPVIFFEVVHHCRHLAASLSSSSPAGHYFSFVSVIPFINVSKLR